MNQDKDRSKKVVALSFLFGAMMFSFMIRFALGVVAPTLMKLYNISPATMGYILSGWNWSYTGSLLFAGPIVDRVGPWMAMGVGSVIWGLSTAALPLIATAGASLFLMRMIFGLGQGILLPSTATSVSRLFGAKERTRAISVAFSGNVLGLAASGAISAFILSRLGWEAVFYCLGGGSLLLTLAWFYFYPDKRIGRHAAEPNRGEAGDHQRVPWLSLFHYRSTWGIAFGQMGYLYAYFFFVSWLPGYLVLERGMTALRSGLVSSLLFGMGMLGTLAGGWLGDYLIQRGVSPTVSRKSIIGIGLSGATVLVIAAAYISQAWLAVALLTVCVGSLRLATGPANSLPIDLAPRSVVGSLTSIQNFFGNVGGLLAPIVTGYIVQSTGSFVGSLVVAGGMALFGAISYVFIMGNLETHRIEPTIPAAAVPLSPSRAL